MSGKSWELLSEHTLIQRARILAEIAFSDFANDRHGMTERAAFRIAEALEKYEQVDVATKAFMAGHDGMVGGDNVTDFADNVVGAADDLISILERAIRMHKEKRDG